MDITTTNNAAIWQAIQARTTSSAWVGRVRNLLTASAVESFGRVADISARVELAMDDVIQDARLAAHARLSELSADAGMYPVSAIVSGAECGVWQCGHGSCAEVRESADALVIDGVAVRGWYVSRSTACGSCAQCVARVRCASRVTVWEWLPVMRVIGRALRTAVRSYFRADRSFAETLTAESWSTVADTVTVEAVAQSAIPSAVREIIASVIAQAVRDGLPVVTAHDGRPTAEIGDRIAAHLGYAASPRGRRSAYAALSAML